MSDVKPTFTGEVQLASWSESHSGGAKIVLWLNDPAELDAFRALTVRKGNVAGQRFMAVLVEIGDDEQPVEAPSSPPPEPTPPAVKPFSGLTRLAIEWCEMPAFWGWATRNFPSFGRVVNAEQAKALILDRCCIKSRSELNTNQEAARYFDRYFRRPFSSHLERNS